MRYRGKRKRKIPLHINTTQRGRIRTVLFTVLIVCVYSIFFVPMSAQEVTLIPSWVNSNIRSAAIIDDAEVAIPFHYQHLFGYTTSDGTIMNVVPVSYGVSYSNTYYSLYDPINHPILVYTRKKKLAHAIDQYGYPRFYGERIIVLDQNGSSISEWSRGGEHWSRDFGGIISAVDGTENILLLGFFNGALVTLDSSGNTIAQLSPPEGESALFSAVAVADNEQIYVAYAEIRRQLLVYMRTEDQLMLAHAINVPPSSHAHPTYSYIQFIPSSQNFIYFDGLSLYLYNFADAHLTLLRQGVELIDIDMNTNYIAAITRDFAHTMLHIYSVHGTPFVRVPLIDMSSVSDHFVRFSTPTEMSVLIGIENTIVSLQEEAP